MPPRRSGRLQERGISSSHKMKKVVEPVSLLSSSSSSDEVPTSQVTPSLANVRQVDPTSPADDRFVDDAAKQRYKSDFRSRAVCYGRWIDFSYFQKNGLDLLSYFQALGWASYMQSEDMVYFRLVVDFYTNMKQLPDQSLVTFVKGVNIHITEKFLAAVYGFPMNLPFVSNMNFDVKVALSHILTGDGSIKLSTLSAVKLPPLARVLHKITNQVIIPRGGKFDAVTREQVFVIYHLLQHLPLNWPSIMITLMRKVIEEYRDLPYGQLLTRLFIHCGVDVSTEPYGLLDRSHRFGEKALHSMHLVLVGGQLVRTEPTSSDIRALLQREHSSHQMIRDLADSVRALHLKVDRIQEEQTEIKETLAWIKGYYDAEDN